MKAKKMFILLAVAFSASAISARPGYAVSGKNMINDRREFESVPYSPNALFIWTDTAGYSDRVYALRGSGFGYRFRVTGIISSAVYGQPLAFAYAIVPDYCPRMRVSDKSDMTAAYYLDESPLNKSGKPAHDGLLSALLSMEDPETARAELDALPKEAKDRLSSYLSKDQYNPPDNPDLPPNIREKYLRLMPNLVTRDDDCPGYDANNLPQRNFTRHFSNEMGIVFVIVDGGDPVYDWTQEMVDNTIEQDIFALNHLAWMCEEADNQYGGGFPVTFHTVFEKVDIPNEPIKGIRKGDWFIQANQALMNTGADYHGINNITWYYGGLFGVDQMGVVYTINNTHPDSTGPQGDCLWFMDGPVDWAAMWDTCWVVGGMHAMVGIGGGSSGLPQLQKWVNVHEILHIFGAADEYIDGYTCNIGNCDLKFGIYAHPNLNCEYCQSGTGGCIMKDVFEWPDHMCYHTRRHVGLIDENNDDGPDPLQQCTHTALVRAPGWLMPLGSVFVAYTLDNYYLLSIPVSRLNSFVITSTGERVLIVPNINQYRTEIVCGLYKYKIHYYGGGASDEYTWGASQWQSPDHEQGFVHTVSITDSTLHFKIDYVANLILTVETTGGYVLCRPVCGQLFGGQTYHIPMGMMISDGSYAVKVRGWLPDGTGPIHRSIDVTIDNGPPGAPSWTRQSLDLNNGVATYEIGDGGITQYFKPTEGGSVIDSISVIDTYQMDCSRGSKWYHTSIRAGNVNGETGSSDVDSFLTKPNTISMFSGYVDSVWIPDTVLLKGPGPDEPMGYWKKINEVTLTWWKPANQEGIITTIRIDHGYYNNSGQFVHELTGLPTSPKYPYTYKYVDLLPNADHHFTIYTLDEYGQVSTPSDCLHFRVGEQLPYGDNDNSTPISKLLPPGISDVSNYPNPFNPRTKINYTISDPAHVRVVVFNILAQVVSILVDEKQDAGKHGVIWDGSDYANGIYIYRIDADEFVETKTMLLVK